MGIHRRSISSFQMVIDTRIDDRRTVERALKEEFKGIKIKCKIEEPMFDRLRAIRDVAGPEFKVMVHVLEESISAEIGYGETNLGKDNTDVQGYQIA